MNKYLYKIKDLEVPPWLKYWFARKSKVNFDLSEILNGTNFDLENSVNKKLHLINIFGNSEQETTTGKNLLPYPYKNGTKTDNGVVFTDNGDGSITINGTAGSGGSSFFLIGQYGATNNIPDKLKTNLSFQATGQSDVILQASLTESEYNIYANNQVINKDWTNVTGGYIRIIIREGTIVNNLKVKPYIVEGTYTSETFPEYEPYTDGASPNPRYPQKINSSGDNGYIVEKFTNSDNTQSQTYTIPCQQPMRSIGNVKDTFVKVNGVWYERHNIRKVVLDGTENWIEEGGGAPFTLLNIDFKYPQSNNDMPLIKTNYYISVPYNGRWTDYSSIVTISQIGSSTKRVKFRNTAITSLENWKNWLSHHNVTLIYVLVTPIDLPCTRAQITVLEQLQKAKTYKDVTHIYTDDEVPAELQIQYYKEKGE